MTRRKELTNFQSRPTLWFASSQRAYVSPRAFSTAHGHATTAAQWPWDHRHVRQTPNGLEVVR